MKSINAAEVKKILDSKEEVVVLDVRSPEEYLKSKISCGINLPYEEINKRIESIIPDKKSKIIVYCLSGSRSAIAAQTLEALGYTHINDLENGLLAWRANGFELG